MRTFAYIQLYLKKLLLLFLLSYSLESISQNIDFGKSYINITKGLNGGTIETGDVLEIRASFVVRSGTYDSCRYTDAIPTGTTYIANTVRVLTNEGKIYKQFTDAAGDDAGWTTGSAPGSMVRINLGFVSPNAATWSRRGRVANTHRPSFYGGTCIMIASFRVTITAATGSLISIGGGNMTYKVSGSSSTPTTFTFPANTLAVYTNYGICANSVGTNALGTESNGTFGSGAPQNRGTSANVPTGYTYATFASGAPGDYFYGIANNTSNGANFTTSNAWAIPDNSTPTHRVFNVWDIIGDHTGASNPLLGNSPGNNSSNTGYMLVINAAYRIDSAFQQTISGLCPNTYYEISCWMRNICSRCGCDSAGRGAGTAGYIPTALNDSSGVYPNLTFEINGVDYYSTGNLTYTGQWVKKGFTFLTGPAQTSFTLKFFNNAPGGGGNDWALDDISVATCSPNLIFTPSNNPTFCEEDIVTMGGIVRSYFNNYTHFKWQRSTDNGSNWSDVTSASTGSPTWNGSEWEYSVSYPSFAASPADNGHKYKLVVATTNPNLGNNSCSLSETGNGVLTLNIIECPVLSTYFVSFNGMAENNLASLRWTTSKETEPLKFIIEKSEDGITFSPVGMVMSYENYDNALNSYIWKEASSGKKYFYRVKLVGKTIEKYTRIITTSSPSQQSDQIRVVNPFSDQLLAEIETDEAGLIRLELIDNSGIIVRQQTLTAVAGINQVIIPGTIKLPNGLYNLKCYFKNKIIVKRVLKNK